MFMSCRNILTIRGLTVCISMLRQWLSTDGTRLANIQRRGLEAASVLLTIVTTPGIDPRAIQEEVIEASIQLMRSNLMRNILPTLNETAFTTDSVTSSAESPSKHRRASLPTFQDGPTSPRKRRRSVAQADAPGILVNVKKVHKMVLESMPLQLLLIERLERLAQDLPLDDSHVLILTSACLGSLEVDPNAHLASATLQLQLACLSLITTVFRRNPKHRETILLQDVFPIMLKLPTSKRSMRSFPIRYTSVSSPNALAAWNASLVRDVVSPPPPPHAIQVMTALILQLLQSTVTRPTHPPPAPHGDTAESPEPVPPRSALMSGLSRCHALADAFVRHLLHRCARGCNTNAKGVSSGVSEFRPVLLHLVQDLLLVFLTPEYPAASVVLSCLTRRLGQDITRASPKLGKSMGLTNNNNNNNSNNTKVTLEITYLNTAFDVMGKICALQARLLATHRDKPLKGTPALKHHGLGDDEQGIRLRCFCADERTDKFLIRCDNCHADFHGTCVGIHRDAIPEEWVCDACRIGRIMERERVPYQLNPQLAGLVDEIYALHHSFLSNISHRAGVSSDFQDAANFHLAQWVDELESKNENKHEPLALTARLLEFWNKAGPGGEPLTEEGTNRLILSLMATTSPLVQSFRPQVSFLVKVMADESSHTLRKLSLKAVEKVNSIPGYLVGNKRLSALREGFLTHVVPFFAFRLWKEIDT